MVQLILCPVKWCSESCALSNGAAIHVCQQFHLEGSGSILLMTLLSQIRNAWLACTGNKTFMEVFTSILIWDIVYFGELIKHQTATDREHNIRLLLGKFVLTGSTHIITCIISMVCIITIGYCTWETLGIDFDGTSDVTGSQVHGCEIWVLYRQYESWQISSPLQCLPTGQICASMINKC